VSQTPTLEERYGAPSPLRRRVVVVGSVLLALVFLAWLGWATLAHADPDVTSELVRFTVDDEHSATAEVDVKLADDDVEATCTVRAIAADHAVVGELTFDVDAGALAGGTPLERVIRTDRRATSVDLVGCTTPDQKRPR
jgi:hypothetical protein